jgi:hypothetical protein
MNSSATQLRSTRNLTRRPPFTVRKGISAEAARVRNVRAAAAARNRTRAHALRQLQNKIVELPQQIPRYQATGNIDHKPLSFEVPPRPSILLEGPELPPGMQQSAAIPEEQLYVLPPPELIIQENPRHLSGVLPPNRLQPAPPEIPPPIRILPPEIKEYREEPVQQNTSKRAGRLNLNLNMSSSPYGVGGRKKKKMSQKSKGRNKKSKSRRR